MLTAGEILILTGTPGAGKTTSATLLAGRPERGAHVESDWFFRSIRSGLIAPHLAESAVQNDAIMDIATDVAIGYARAEFAVVWDGIVGPWYLERIMRRIEPTGITVHYAIIQANREVALERVATRDDTIEVSGAAVMFDKFVDVGEFQSHVIAGDGSVDTIVERIEQALSVDRLRLRMVDRDGRSEPSTT